MASIRALPGVLGLLAAMAAAVPGAAAESFTEAAHAVSLPLIIDNPGTADGAALLQALTGVVPATIKVTGRFSWDVGRGRLVDPVGDMVATIDGGDITSQLAQIQAILNKWVMVRALERDSEHRGLDLSLLPDDDVHHPGDRVTLVVDGFRYPYLTLVDLAADGSIALLYPLNSGNAHDNPALAPGTPYRLPLQVTPPLGADHFLAIASASVLSELHWELAALSGRRVANALPGLLDRALTGQTYQLDVHCVYSAP